MTDPAGRRGLDQLVQAARVGGGDAGRALARGRAGALRAGAASMDLPLPAGTPIGGYLDTAPRRSCATGSINLTAINLCDDQTSVALLGIDAATVTPFLRDAMAARLPEGTRLITTASHCHTGPGGLGPSTAEQLFLGPFAPELCAQLVDAWAQCFDRAAATLQPAKLSRGALRADGLVENRSEARQPVDQTLDLLLLHDQKDALIARLLAFPAHATLVEDQDRLDGDYPAALRARLDPRGAEVPTLFSASATGSAAFTPLSSEEPARSAGAALAALMQQRAAALSSIEVEAFAQQRIEVEMPVFRPPERSYGVLRELLERIDLPASLPVDLLRLGPVLIAVIPGELSAEVTPALRREFEARGLHLVLMAHSGAYGGYFMPDTDSRQAGPESYLEVFGPGTAQIFSELLLGVAEGMRDAACPG